MAAWSFRSRSPSFCPTPSPAASLSEQRPRLQSRVQLLPLRLGNAVVFPVHQRPVPGTRGPYRVNMRLP